ncbi:MAG: hypothetical protein NWF14_02460 [Candidatus Bathyarchaeota archaeon]|nr:hypothetical protein [Candidatus Bathyarchaeota archaeon]
MRRCILDDAVKSEIIRSCEEEASPHDIVAASICNPLTSGHVDPKGKVNVLLIISSPRLTLKYRRKPLGGGTLALLLVDQETFEKDVERDWLGGLLVEGMLVPYEPLINGDFLRGREVKAKKRIINEILGNLVLEYPQMSHELLIKPEYFMFEAMARKASLYPPITYKFLNILEGDLSEKNVDAIMEGFKAALRAAAEEESVTLSNGYVKITKKYIDAVQRKRLRVLNILKTVRSSILRHSFEVFPKMMRSLIEDYWQYTKHFVDWDALAAIPLPELEDTKRHILIPTSLGLVPLSDKMTVEEFVKRTVPNGHNLEMDIEKLGGVLNAVYAIRLHREKGERKVVVKIFKNWYGWKWFPLALWALGTRGFTVLGKSRLEKEYAINRFLSKRGFNVPQIIHVSPEAGLVFQEYVEGKSLAEVIKKICSSKKENLDLIAVIRQVGSEIAKVHKLKVALGDCKPENTIIAQDGRIFFVDLEQAVRDGDQAWDLAELLYFSGHYAPLTSVEVAQRITEEFIDGYLEAGGNTENIKKARSPRYIKVFSFFTPPHILYAISSTCREKLKGKK